MTTLTATEGIPAITTDLPNWQPATWEDYLSDRDNSSIVLFLLTAHR